MKDKERIAFEIPAQTYRALQQIMVDLGFKTVADVVRHLMQESAEVKTYMREKNIDLDFGGGRWGGKRKKPPNPSQ